MQPRTSPSNLDVFLGKESKDIPKRKHRWKWNQLRNVWKTQSRLEQGPVVAIDTCTEFRIIFRRYVIVIWKESPSSKRRALHKGKLDFTAWVLFHCLGIALTVENQTLLRSERSRASQQKSSSLTPGRDWLTAKKIIYFALEWLEMSNIEAVCKEVRR